MPGIEDRLAKIKAIQAEAETKKAAEKEKTTKESAEKKTGLEQEKAQVEGELAQTTEELQKNETGLAEINAMDLSALDPESRAGIEAEIVGIKEEMDGLKGKIEELAKRKQEIDEELKGVAGETEKTSDDEKVEASPESAKKEDPELTKIGKSSAMESLVNAISWVHCEDLLSPLKKKDGRKSTLDNVIKESVERIAKIRQAPELVLQEIQQNAETLVDGETKQQILNLKELPKESLNTFIDKIQARVDEAKKQYQIWIL
ncbi:MAG: hypothetical protein AAB666_00260 [Patescibacteria group bacterium]